MVLECSHRLCEKCVKTKSKYASGVRCPIDEKIISFRNIAKNF
jgi:hypothetical protein